MMSSTSVVNVPVLQSSGKHTDPSSAASNLWYAISVDYSSNREKDIPCPKRQVMLINSVLFVKDLI